MGEMTKKMSFFTKDLVKCPCCENPTSKEEMLTGRGRLSAKELTLELRRLYAPLPELGIVTPLMYSLITCPKCYCSLLPADFGAKNFPPEASQKLMQGIEKRFTAVKKIFQKDIDFTKPKDLTGAAASYYLAIASYGSLPAKFSPTIKSSMLYIRFYWLLSDLEKTSSKDSPDYKTMRTKLLPQINQYFQLAKEKMNSRQEEFPAFFGPDTDRNNNFEGFIYLCSYFQFQISLLENNPINLEKDCLKIKQDLSKIFGFGKISKSRPAAILEIVRTLYDQVDNQLKQLQHSLD